jgi:ABC-type amino acid transport substrate-binding protein
MIGRSTMWRARLIVVGLVAASLASGCAGLGLDGDGGTHRVRSTGQLRVGMAGDYPPLNARTLDGSLIGLDADLAASLAAILKVELVLVEKPIGELLDAVRKGEVDVAISGLTMTPRRNLDVAFAGPYYLARKAMLAKGSRLDGVTHVRDLQGRGLSIVAVAGGTSEELVRRALPEESARFVPDQANAITMLVEGEADVLVADDPVVRFALLRYPEAGLIMVESAYSAEPIGIAVSPDDPLFVNLVENYLRNLEQIGLMDRLREKWFENDDWIGRIE